MKRFAPFYRLWLAERRRHVITKADLAAHKRHFAIAVAQRNNALAELRTAVDQRNRARDIVVAIEAGEAWEWDDEQFDAWLRSLGERPA
jgi:hypothetical protein